MLRAACGAVPIAQPHELMLSAVLLAANDGERHVVSCKLLQQAAARAHDAQHTSRATVGKLDKSCQLQGVAKAVAWATARRYLKGEIFWNQQRAAPEGAHA